MKLSKFSQHGIAHILAPIAFIVIFAAIGGLIILRGHAASAISCYISGPTSAKWGQTIPQSVHIINGSSSSFTPHTILDVTDYNGSKVVRQHTYGPWKGKTVAPNSTRVVGVFKDHFKYPYTKSWQVFGDSKKSFTCEKTVIHKK